MLLDHKICIKCLRDGNDRGTETPCIPLLGKDDLLSIAKRGEIPRGCDKLLEHAAGYNERVRLRNE